MKFVRRKPTHITTQTSVMDCNWSLVNSKNCSVILHGFIAIKAIYRFDPVEDMASTVVVDRMGGEVEWPRAKLKAAVGR